MFRDQISAISQSVAAHRIIREENGLILLRTAVLTKWARRNTNDQV